MTGQFDDDDDDHESQQVARLLNLNVMQNYSRMMSQHFGQETAGN